MKKTILYITIAVLLAAGYFFYSTTAQANSDQAELAALETVEVQMGTLSAQISATGTVRSNQSAVITWGTSGRVGVVNAAAGDPVQSGDILADLVQTSLPQNVIMAKVDLVNAQDALENLSDSYSALALADAQKAIADAADAVEETERTLRNYQTPAPQTDIDQAYADMILARDQLDKAEDRYEPYSDKPEDNLTRANLLSKLATAQEQYDDTVLTYNSLRGTASETTIAVARADVDVAREQLIDAQDEVQRLLDGVESDDMLAAQAKVAAAEATLSQAWVEAPFDGVITKVFNQSGDLVSAGTQAFQQDDLSRLLVDLEVSEVDITQIEVGQSVEMTFDAIRGRQYHGQVVEVAMVGDNEGGVVSFDVVVELTDPDEDVRPGMTSAVSIVVQQLAEAMLVPNQALRVVDGERVIYILSDLEIPEPEAQSTGGFRDIIMGMRDSDQSLIATTMIEITVGATSDSYTQIIDGDLQLGDQVVLNPPVDMLTNIAPGTGGPFGR
ncbi:MAG: efflux RND transporter periplasmic adaptor subunit [Chloroflexota bacterium]